MTLSVSTIFSIYRQRSALKVKLESPGIRLPFHTGSQSYRWKVGETVKSLCYTPPIEVVIVDQWMENGYCYYLAGGIVHREKDILTE